MKTRTSVRNIMIAAVAVTGTAIPAMADFSYTSFTSTSGLNLVGAAVQDVNRILVTPSVRSTAGAVWVQEKQNVGLGFETTMTIKVEDIYGGGADGMALVIQNSSATALGSTGGGVGYGTNPTFGFAGIANSLAIVVDMWDNNPNWPEPGNNHIAIQSRGTLQNVPDITGTLASAAIADLSDGLQHTIRVHYTPGIMSVYVDGSVAPTVQVAVDLESLLALDHSAEGGIGQAYIGVTAATGANQDREAHVLNALCSSSTIPTPGAASLLACGGLVGLRRRRKA